MLRFHGLLICALFASTLLGSEPTLERLRLDNPDAANVKMLDGTIEISGSTALEFSANSGLDDGVWVLDLRYFSIGGVDNVSLIPLSNDSDPGRQSLGPMGHSETFSPYASKFKLEHRGTTAIRIDLKLKPDSKLQLKDVTVRRERPGEFGSAAHARAHAASAKDLKSYLSKTFDSEIQSVSVESDTIRISGQVGSLEGEYLLGDIPMEALVSQPNAYHSLVPIIINEGKSFTVAVPRVVEYQGRSFDRLTSRWQLYRRSGTTVNVDSLIPVSHARYADSVACRNPNLPEFKLKSKKGLGGWSPKRAPELADEIESLGIAAVTVNVSSLHAFATTTPAKGYTPFEYQGRTYYANEARLKAYDQTFREAQRQGVMVSAILLVDNPAGSSDHATSLLGHPDAVRDGMFAMPNVTSTEGIAYYGAIVDLMASRWSSGDGVHGRVHQWIVHNEVDFGWVWTNAGRKEDIVYMDLYQRSMRLVDLITRQYDPNARAWISLTHHWADKGTDDGYGSKRMLDLLSDFCSAEGNFPWALAYHPYPQSLFNPRTWEDHQATKDFNTKKITPRNIEVLDAYMKIPEMLYHGKVRPVHLSENGFNSKDYSEKSLEDQAAGMALAWKKIQHLSSIENWQYHNWIDNRHEGGLRIGLRKFPDEPGDPLGKKPIWHLYQALGTEREDEIAKPYLKTIGIRSWDEVIRPSTFDP